ncbi:hypothetical protein D6777_04790 [Candidatus Woesearchaeota archaeon]|nr:MAG: hypothetical protein D6777_04790 [Candidatus Woesearchaeota archaeon]
MSKLDEVIERIRREQHFFKKIDLREGDISSGQINLENHELILNYNPDWLKENSSPQLSSFLSKMNIDDEKILEVLVRDVFYHEIGHRGSRKEKGCPGNVQVLAKSFLDPLYKSTGIEDKASLAYLANSLTDLIDNTILRKVDDDTGLSTMNGFYLFLYEQSKLAGKFNKIYEAYARLSLYLFGTKPAKELIKPALTYDPEVNTAITNFLERTGISSMTTIVQQGSKTVKVKDVERIREYLKDENNWEDIARIYGEEIGKLFDKDMNQQNLFGSGSSDSDSSDSGDNGSESSDSGSSGSDDNGSAQGEDLDEILNKIFGKPQSGSDNNFEYRDGFSDELNRKDTKRDIIRSYFGGSEAGTMPGWMENFEYLENLYELLASDKVFELVMPPTEAKTFPIINIGEKSFDYEENSVSDIVGVGFNGSSLDLLVARYKYEISVKATDGYDDKPDFAFCMLDTSGSMLEPMPEGPPLGDVVNPKGTVQWRYNSRYHVALIGYFIIEQRFKDLGIAGSDLAFANFSESTLCAEGYQDSRRLALSPQRGGTFINLELIEEYVERTNSIILTISDGDIANADIVAQKLLEVNENNYCIHIQIGEPTQFSEYIRQGGVIVKYIKKEDDFYDFLIDITDRFYR